MASDSRRRSMAWAERTVLIIDDDDELRAGLHELIETRGFRVVATNSGAEALDWLAQGARPALILLDWMMPIMSGQEVLERLTADEALRSIPVTVISAADRGAVPAEHFLPKPIDLDRLLGLLAEHCGDGA